MGDETQYCSKIGPKWCVGPNFILTEGATPPMPYLYTLHLLSQILKFYQMMNLFANFSKLGVRGAHIG
jgi:hypothetical protein